MADIGNPFAPAPVSRWVVQTPGPGLVRHQIKSNKRAQLLAEASSLVPSQQELLDTLSKHNLAYGDNMMFQNMLGAQLKGYLDRYQENPYYAFSRDGKEKVKSMRSLVNNPALAQAAASYDVTKNTRDIASKDGNLHNFNVIDGSVSVLDRPTGRIDRVSFDALNEKFDNNGKTEDRYIPLTFEQESNTRLEKGFVDIEKNKVDGPVGYNMARFADIVNGVNSILGDAGSTEYNTFKTGLDKLEYDIKTKNNVAQINKKLDALLTGLPANFKDTLLAKAYADQYRMNSPKDSRKAYAQVADMLRKMAEGRYQTSEVIDLSTKGKEDVKGGSAKLDDKMGRFESAILGEGAETVPVNVPSKKSATGKAQVMAKQVDPTIFQDVPTPLQDNILIQSWKKPDAQVRVAENDEPIDMRNAIPAPDPKVMHYVDPDSTTGQEIVEMDVLASDDGSGSTGWSEKTQGKTKFTPSERTHWEQIGKALNQKNEMNPDVNKFVAYEDENMFNSLGRDQYRVRVKFEANPEAPKLIRMRVDKKDLNVPKGVNIPGGTPSTEYAGIERDPE